jgi:hypothetical protein
MLLWLIIYLFILLNKNDNPYRSDEGMFCSEHCTEYSREALGPLLGPSILLKNVAPETSTHSPWSSLVQCKASTSTRTSTSTSTHFLQYPPSLSDLSTTRSPPAPTGHSTVRYTDQVSQQLGVLVPGSNQPPRHPVSPLKLVPASILQPTFGLLTEDSGQASGSRLLPTSRLRPRPSKPKPK